MAIHGTPDSPEALFEIPVIGRRLLDQGLEQGLVAAAIVNQFEGNVDQIPRRHHDVGRQFRQPAAKKVQEVGDLAPPAEREIGRSRQRPAQVKNRLDAECACSSPASGTHALHW